MLNSIIANFLAKFKTKSPVLFVVVAALLSGLKYVIDAGVIPGITPDISEWVLWAIALFIGTPTTKFLDGGDTK